MSDYLKILLAFVIVLLVGCGGNNGPDTKDTPTQYLATDASCVLALSRGGVPGAAVGIAELEVYFGIYSENISDLLSTSTSATFTLQSPGRVSFNGVTLDIKSVCIVTSNGSNWRYVYLTNGDILNIDQASQPGSKPCVSGDDFSSTLIPRGGIFKCRA